MTHPDDENAPPPEHHQTEPKPLPRPKHQAISWRRLRALCWKEGLQIFRDPSSNIIAFVLPVIMLLIFGYGINLDSTKINIGLVQEDHSREAQRFADSLTGSPYLKVRRYASRENVHEAITKGEVRGFIAIANDFADKLKHGGDSAPVQVVSDGSEPNIAVFVEGYARGAWQTWQYQRAKDAGMEIAGQIGVEPRFWYNPSAESRNYLIPGSITIIMTVIGALLTSLVIAREWERGTMEALLASPITRVELLLSKIIPYYILGIISLLICVALATWVMDVPFRGSVFVLLIVGTFFLLSVLGLGLLISASSRSQFNAAQAALNAGFLPALMLSGFVYEIGSMPTAIQWVTHIIPARYFVTSMQTLFQAGTIWSVIGPDILFLVCSSIFFLGMASRKLSRTLE